MHTCHHPTLHSADDGPNWLLVAQAVVDRVADSPLTNAMALRELCHLAKREGYWFLQAVRKRPQWFEWGICVLVWFGGINGPLPSDYKRLEEDPRLPILARTIWTRLFWSWDTLQDISWKGHSNFFHEKKFASTTHSLIHCRLLTVCVWHWGVGWHARKAPVVILNIPFLSPRECFASDT